MKIIIIRTSGHIENNLKNVLVSQRVTHYIVVEDRNFYRHCGGCSTGKTFLQNFWTKFWTCWRTKDSFTTKCHELNISRRVTKWFGSVTDLTRASDSFKILATDCCKWIMKKTCMDIVTTITRLQKSYKSMNTYLNISPL